MASSHLSEEDLNRIVKLILQDNEICADGDTLRELPSVYQPSPIEKTTPKSLDACPLMSKWTTRLLAKLWALIINPRLIQQLYESIKLDGWQCTLERYTPDIVVSGIATIVTTPMDSYLNSLQGVLIEMLEEYFKSYNAVKTISTGLLWTVDTVAATGIVALANLGFRLVYWIFANIAHYFGFKKQGVTLKSTLPFFDDKGKFDWRATIQYVVSTVCSAVLSIFVGPGWIGVAVVFGVTLTLNILLYFAFRLGNVLKLNLATNMDYIQEAIGYRPGEFTWIGLIDENEIIDELAKKMPDEHIKNLQCPISHSLMVDPVILSCGCIFDKMHIAKWLRSQKECPMCRCVVARNSDYWKPANNYKQAIALLTERYEMRLTKQ